MSSPASSALPILVVEDEASVMGFMVAALERSGYKTVTANSGAEALKILTSGHYLGVITDMRTPGGVSGADVHAWIVHHRPELSRRVIFVTGDTVNVETTTALDQTGAPCIEKPFRVAQLIEVVQKTFGKP